MSLKILFTHSFFLRLDAKQLETAKPYPPLGTLYAMSWLRELGHEVELHDATFTTGPEAIREPLARLRPDLLCCGTTTSTGSPRCASPRCSGQRSPRCTSRRSRARGLSSAARMRPTTVSATSNKGPPRSSSAKGDHPG